MEKQPPKCLAELAAADWENTPESVKRLVGQLLERIVALEERQQSLAEQLQRNSKNSSQPRSQDEPQGFKPKPQAQSKKRRGAQAGHQGHPQKLYPPENCADITEPYPRACHQLVKLECGIHSIADKNDHDNATLRSER